VAREKEQEHDPNLGPAVSAVHIGGESILDRIVPHMKKIAVAAVALTVILSVYFGMRWWKYRKAERSTDKLARALEVAERDVVAEITPPLPPIPGAPEVEKPETFPTYAARAEATLAELRKAGPTRGAASLYEAQLLIQANKLDEALAIYRRVGSGKSTDAAIAREGVGVVLETKAGVAKDPAEHQKLLEEALAAYRAIQTDDKGPRRDYSLYHEARVLEAMGKPAEAIAALKKAQEVTPDSQLKPLIEQHLATLGAGEGS
jgi:tetratricopeptide (TPR) repeat protein